VAKVRVEGLEVRATGPNRGHRRGDQPTRRKPHPSNHKKLAGAERTYRIRVGEYRVIYEVLGEVLLIEVIKVGHRKDVYR
jgi:mRNA-degrading endonuclease RelE of RelBE toxin-antitoxin system